MSRAGGGRGVSAGEPVRRATRLQTALASSAARLVAEQVDLATAEYVLLCNCLEKCHELETTKHSSLMGRSHPQTSPSVSTQRPVYWEQYCTQGVAVQSVPWILQLKLVAEHVQGLLPASQLATSAICPAPKVYIAALLSGTLQFQYKQGNHFMQLRGSCQPRQLL